MMDRLYEYENARETICSECQENPLNCEWCIVEQIYRTVMNEELGEDFPNHVFIHAEDSPTDRANPEKWRARRHRKGDVRAKARKVVVRKKDTGHLKDNRCTTRRKDKMNVED